MEQVVEELAHLLPPSTPGTSSSKAAAAHSPLAALGKHGEPALVELNDRGHAAEVEAAKHIGIRSPLNFPHVSAADTGASNMAHEFFLTFSDGDWYSQHRDDVRARVLALPSLAKQVTDRELWLRGSDSPGHWPYDVRVFLDPGSVLIEVTTFGSAYFQDVRALLSSLASTVGVELADDDGQPVRWPSRQHK